MRERERERERERVRERESMCLIYTRERGREREGEREREREREGGGGVLCVGGRPHTCRATRFLLIPLFIIIYSYSNNIYTHPQDILHQMYEQGAQFSLKDYTNAIKLLAYSQPSYDSDRLSARILAIETFFSQDTV